MNKIIGDKMMDLKELIKLLANKGYVTVEKQYKSKFLSMSDQTKDLPRYVITTKFESVFQKLREYDNYSQKGIIHSYKMNGVQLYRTVIYIGKDVIKFLEKYDDGNEIIEIPINLYKSERIKDWIDEFTKYTYHHRNYSVSFTTYTYFINDKVRNRRLKNEALKKKEVDDFINSL